MLLPLLLEKPGLRRACVRAAVQKWQIMAKRTEDMGVGGDGKASARGGGAVLGVPLVSGTGVGQWLVQSH